MTLTRRTFLSRSSIGAAIAGGLALVPVMSGVLKMQAKPAAIPFPGSSAEPLVAHVRDVNSGEISLLVGTGKVVVHDLDLAARLYAAARR